MHGLVFGCLLLVTGKDIPFSKPNILLLCVDDLKKDSITRYLLSCF